MSRRRNKYYDRKLKLQAVQDYLGGGGSLRTICKKHGIKDKKQLRNWIKWYNGHKEIKERRAAGTEIYMTKGRKTTEKERAEIVAFCIEHGKNYPLTIKTYGVSYQQIYAWVRKYEEKGVAGLVDGRGRNKPESEMTEVEKLRVQSKLLQAQIKDKEMEIALLKKIERIGEVGCLSGVRQEKKHLAVRSVHEEKHYSVNRLCDILNLNRSSYYKWLRRKESQVETENRRIIEWVKELYEEQNGILGYRQMTITINRDKNTQYNVKRIRRLMRYLRLKVCLPQKTGKLYSVHTGNNSRKHFES